MGATIGYLHEKHGIEGVGIDPSKKLLDVGRKKFGSLDFILGTGDYLPFEEKSIDCVFAECTLSLMDNISKTINEVSKVLKNEGSFVITDVYARNSTGINALEDFSFNSCMRGLHDIEHLKESLLTQGFEIMFFEECSELLKELMVKIIFSYGSMDIFWRKATEDSDCANGRKFQEILKACKPGYFMIIAKKGNKSNG